MQNIRLQVSLPKLREFHGSFKSVCDNFSIDESEFAHIFNCDYNVFKMWDTDENGLIDALEIFSGLILFTTAKFNDKIRCKCFLKNCDVYLVLFDLFDFNELSSLAIIDIEFMINCCLNSTFKMYQINTDVDDGEIN